MAINHDFKNFDEKAHGAKEWLEREFNTVRTGRASPVLLDGVRVTAYGSLVPLKQVAGIALEDARTIRVTPYDPTLAKDIERAITQADLGVGIGADQSGVRVTVPDLTAERREQLLKLAKQKLEEARTTIRVARDEARKDIQEQERAGDMTEDDKYLLSEELQKRVDKVNEQMEMMFEKKEKEMAA